MPYIEDTDCNVNAVRGYQHFTAIYGGVCTRNKLNNKRTDVLFSANAAGVEAVEKLVRTINRVTI